MSENYNNFLNSLVRFYAVSDFGSGEHWPSNTGITYAYELVDTHNSMDHVSGYFTAPFSGLYGFFFTAVMYKWEMNYFNNIHIHINDINVACYNFQYDKAATTETIYFANYLNAGDRFNIFQAEGTGVWIKSNPVTLMGFLVEKN